MSWDPYTRMYTEHKFIINLYQFAEMSPVLRYSINFQWQDEVKTRSREILCQLWWVNLFRLGRLLMVSFSELLIHISRVSCQKGPTRHAYAWQIEPFWQDTLDMFKMHTPSQHYDCWYLIKYHRHLRDPDLQFLRINITYQNKMRNISLITACSNE